MITAEKVVKVYARVTIDGLDFQVFPNGSVYIYIGDDWDYYSSFEDDYAEILAAGLKVLDEE